MARLRLWLGKRDDLYVVVASYGVQVTHLTVSAANIRPAARVQER